MKFSLYFKTKSLNSNRFGNYCQRTGLVRADSPQTVCLNLLDIFHVSDLQVVPISWYFTLWNIYVYYIICIIVKLNAACNQAPDFLLYIRFCDMYHHVVLSAKLHFLFVQRPRSLILSQRRVKVSILLAAKPTLGFQLVLDCILPFYSCLLILVLSFSQSITRTSSSSLSGRLRILVFTKYWKLSFVWCNSSYLCSVLLQTDKNFHSYLIKSYSVARILQQFAANKVPMFHG